MTELPGGGGNAGIVKAIQNLITYSQSVLKENVQGKVFASFLVEDDETVRDARIVKGTGGGCDETVLATVQQLPCFVPAKQAGRPVSVAFTLPVSFPLPTMRLFRKPLERHAHLIWLSDFLNSFYNKAVINPRNYSGLKAKNKFAP